MANTTQRKTTASKNEAAVSTNTTNDSALLAENKELKNKVEDMESKLNLLMTQLSTMMAQSQIQSRPHDQKEIKVVSLVPGKLILSTTGKADGRMYKFEHQFDFCLIPEQDLKEICLTGMQKAARKGKFYIEDQDFVRENGLASYYSKMLDQAGLTNILSLNVKDFKEKFNSILPTQRSIIEDMVGNKRINGESVDANVLMALKELTGRDYLNIEPLNINPLNGEG